MNNERGHEKLTYGRVLGTECKSLSINDQTLNEFNDLKIKYKRTLKGVSKTVVKTDITHKDYVDVLDTNKSIKRDASSIRSFNHQIYTFKQSKIALTSVYGNMQMTDNVNCVPYGYNPSNEKPVEIPDAEPGEEQ